MILHPFCTSVNRPKASLQNCERFASDHWRRLPLSSSRHERCKCGAVAQNKDVKLVQFKDGSYFSPIVNGTWQLAGGHGRAVFDQVFDRLKPHAEANFTTFDTADIYGPSEEILGQLQSLWTAAGHPPLQIFTKYVPNLNHGPPSSEAVEQAVQRSRRALQVKQIDLLQLHWWDYDVPGLMDVIYRLADLQAEGVIRSLGVTNLDTSHVEKITDEGINLVANQVQFSLLDRRPLGPNGMLQLCKERGLKLLAYGVLGGGLLTDRYLQRGESPIYGSSQYRLVDLDTSSLKMYWNVVQRFGGEKLWRQLLHVLREVADKHQSSTAAVSLQWVFAQAGGNVAYPIVGVRNSKHIHTNAEALRLRLDEEDFEYIEEVLRKAQGPTGDIYSFERS